MKKFTVIVAVDVPSYGKVQVEAASEEEASRIVSEDAAGDFDSDWSNCDNLRTI